VKRSIRVEASGQRSTPSYCSCHTRAIKRGQHACMDTWFKTYGSVPNRQDTVSQILSSTCVHMHGLQFWHPNMHQSCLCHDSMPCAGCMFRDLWATQGGSALDVGTVQALPTAALSTASLVNSSFGDIPDYAVPEGHTNKNDRSTVTGIVFFQNKAAIRLQSTRFNAIRGHPLVVSDGTSDTKVYRDDPSINVVATSPKVKALPLQAATNWAFLDLNDSWLVANEKVRGRQ
jgi:hypothetical protein